MVNITCIITSVLTESIACATHILDSNLESIANLSDRKRICEKLKKVKNQLTKMLFGSVPLSSKRDAKHANATLAPFPAQEQQKSI